MNHRPYDELRAKMTPERRARNEAAARKMSTHHPFQELRDKMTPEQLRLSEALAKKMMAKIRKRAKSKQSAP